MDEPPHTIFLSYAFEDEDFAVRVSSHLACQRDIRPYCWREQRKAEDWTDQIDDAIDAADTVVVIVGEKRGSTQEDEAKSARTLKKTRIRVDLPDAPEEHAASMRIERCPRIALHGTRGDEAERAAREIMEILQRPFFPCDGNPAHYLYDYEKEIIQAYVTGDLKSGSPPEWPEVKLAFERRYDSTLEDVVGLYRDDDARIVVDAREGSIADGAGRDGAGSVVLTLPEAGPRASLSFPTGDKGLTVGIVVSGGIAPGINAVIESIVTRHLLYKAHAEATAPYSLSINGYMGGFRALIDGDDKQSIPLISGDRIADVVSGIANGGGSILATSRADQLLDADPEERADAVESILATLKHTDILYVIGGDGSMRAAHAIWTAAEREAERRARKNPGKKAKPPVSIVAVPKTMDNDILWVWQAFGFLSAVDRARETIFDLGTEVSANPRLCTVQLFGSDSGFVVSHAVLGSGPGVCDLALIPEVPFSMKGVCKYMLECLDARYANRPSAPVYGMVVLAETAIPIDAEEYLDDPDVALTPDEKTAIQRFLRADGRVRGQTSDELRTGGLKVVSRVLQRAIRNANRAHADYWNIFRVLTSEPRHLIRAARPSTVDVVVGQRLGALAVDNAMAGYTDFMISQWLTEFVLVPLPLVVLGRKRVPRDGIFWRSVRASTGQPADLVG